MALVLPRYHKLLSALLSRLKKLSSVEKSWLWDVIERSLLNFESSASDKAAFADNIMEQLFNTFHADTIHQSVKIIYSFVAAGTIDLDVFKKYQVDIVSAIVSWNVTSLSLNDFYLFCSILIQS
jgi:hypothetical protein